MSDIVQHAPRPVARADDVRRDKHPAAVYLAGLSAGSRDTMSRALDVIAQLLAGDDDATWRDVPWHRLRFQHTQAARSALSDSDYAYTTVNRMLCALRGTLKAAWKLGLMDAETYHRAASISNLSGERVPAGRDLKPSELAGLVRVCFADKKPIGIRDAAIVSVLYGCGVRRAELVGLNLGDYIMEEDELLVRGKGNKQRKVPVAGAGPALRDWLGVRGMEPGALFVGMGNRNQGHRLSAQAVYNMLRKRGKEAGLERFSPHDFRRTFVGDLLDAGADISTVQQMAGHADPATTVRYDRRGKRARRRAAGLLRVPYR